MNHSNHTFSNAVTKPTGPRSRPPIRRSNDQGSPLRTTMSSEKKFNTTKSPNSSSRNTSQGSSILSSPGSPKNKLYPELRDVTFDEDEEGTEFDASTPRSSHRRFESHTKSDYSSESDESLNESECINESKLSNAAPRQSASDENQNNGVYNPLIIFALIVAVILGYFVISSKSSSETLKQNNEIEENEAVAEMLRTRITDLKKLFPSQDKEIWGEIAAGISGVKTKDHRPAIFLLLAIHNETTNCLAKKVAEVAKSALKGTGDVTLTPSMLENNISKVFEVMEERIKQSKAVVVLDLLSLEAEAIKAFHDICDQYNPLVDEAVYLYTMRSELKGKSTNLRAVAERELRNSFTKVIKEDTLKALITRLTNGAVFAITAEERIPCAE